MIHMKSFKYRYVEIVIDKSYVLSTSIINSSCYCYWLLLIFGIAQLCLAAAANSFEYKQRPIFLIIVHISVKDFFIIMNLFKKKRYINGKEKNFLLPPFYFFYFLNFTNFVMSSSLLVTLEPAQTWLLDMTVH